MSDGPPPVPLTAKERADLVAIAQIDCVKISARLVRKRNDVPVFRERANDLAAQQPARTGHNTCLHARILLYPRMMSNFLAVNKRING